MLISIVGIGKPNREILGLNHIIGAIILLASKAIGQYGDLSTVKIESSKASRLLEIALHSHHNRAVLEAKLSIGHGD